MAPRLGDDARVLHDVVSRLVGGRPAAPPASEPMAVNAIGFEWQPDVWLLMVALAVAYWWGVTRLGPRVLGCGPYVTSAQVRRFGLGLVVLFLAASWPIDTIGDEYLFSVHMVQYLLMSLVAPPMLLAGIPGWLLRELTVPVRPVVAFLTRPIVAVVLFDTVLVLTHFPPLVELYVRNDPVHFGMHALWVTTGLVFWMPVLSPVPEYPRLSPPLQTVYLFASSIIPTIPSAFLIWAETPLYPSYAEAPRLWGVSAALDMQLSGIVMKIGGGLVLWSTITAVFFRWALADEGPLPRPERRKASPVSASRSSPP